MQESWVLTLGQEDPLEKYAAPHSSILAWEIPWTEESGGYSPWGPKTVGHVLAARQQPLKGALPLLRASYLCLLVSGLPG